MDVVLIWFPLYVLTATVIVLLVRWGARFFTDSPWPKRIAIFLAVVWPVGDIATIKLLLLAYYIPEGGTHIYETVRDVEGFLDNDAEGCDSGCRQYLIESEFPKYSFIEARTHGPKPDHFVSKAGLYRFTAEQAGHPNCALFYQWIADKKGYQYDRDYQDMCIATWEISEIRSKYAFKSISEKKETFFGNMEKFGYYVYNIETSKTYASSINYLIYTYLLWSKFMNPVIAANVEWFSVFDVLVPVKI